MTEELPHGWVSATVGELAEVLDSRRIPLNQAERAKRPGPYPYFGANGQVDTIDGYLFEGRHILLAEDGGYFDDPFRPNAYEADGKFWVNNHAHILRAGPTIEHAFLLHALNATDLMPFVSGTTRLKLTQADMRRIPVAVPPIAEQRRIVARIEALFARTRQARADLLRIAPLAERFNAALIAKMVCGGTVTGAGESGPPKPPLDPDLAGTWPAPELPDGWQWRTFEDLFDDVTSSQNKLKQRAYQTSGRFPVIDQGEADIGGWSDDAGLAYRGRLPVIIFGDHTRAIKFVDQSFIQGADGVKVLAPKLTAYQPRFAYWALRGLSLPDKGYARHMKFLRASQFPVPPIAAQVTLARSLDNAMQASVTAQRDATRALALLDHLERSILMRAFRGELVPQDPADASSSFHLEALQGSDAPVTTGRSRTPRIPATSAAAGQMKGPRVPKNRADADVKGQPYLAERLRQIGSAATAEDLYRAANLPIADFYKQLSEEVANGWVKDEKGKLEAAP